MRSDPRREVKIVAVKWVLCRGQVLWLSGREPMPHDT